MMKLEVLNLAFAVFGQARQSRHPRQTNLYVSSLSFNMRTSRMARESLLSGWFRAAAREVRRAPRPYLALLRNAYVPCGSCLRAPRREASSVAVAVTGFRDRLPWPDTVAVFRGRLLWPRTVAVFRDRFRG